MQPPRCFWRSASQPSASALAAAQRRTGSTPRSGAPYPTLPSPEGREALSPERDRSERARTKPAVLALSVLLSLASREAAAADRFDAAFWRAAFARPAEPPAPADNPTTPAKVELGRRLFTDKRLSGENDLACATCHDPVLSFSDGVARRP